MKAIIHLSALKKNKVFWVLGALISTTLLLGLYAPFIASSKPLIAYYEGKLYFPLFRCLLYKNIYTKPLDLFFNSLMFVLPLTILGLLFIKKKRLIFLGCCLILQFGVFFYASYSTISKDFRPYFKIDREIASLQTHLGPIESDLKFYVQPPIPFHWEQNALGQTQKNLRINGQNLFATLLFAIRYSFSLALLACFLAFALGTLIGAISGFLGGKIDLLISRFIEVWESLPTLVILLLIVSLTQRTHFIFIAILLAFFSWTSIARFVRVEMLKEKQLSYVQVLRNMETSRVRILWKHLVPNCYWMLLSLMPHALIGAITYESALSFLGLGDRSSCSIGLLLDEARMAYPVDPHLFWPPALLLILILVPLTWLGDLLREQIDSGLNENPF